MLADLEAPVWLIEIAFRSHSCWGGSRLDGHLPFRFVIPVHSLIDYLQRGISLPPEAQRVLPHRVPFSVCLFEIELTSFALGEERFCGLFPLCGGAG